MMTTPTDAASRDKEAMTGDVVTKKDIPNNNESHKEEEEQQPP